MPTKNTQTVLAVQYKYTWNRQHVVVCTFAHTHTGMYQWRNDGMLKMTCPCSVNFMGHFREPTSLVEHLVSGLRIPRAIRFRSSVSDRNLSIFLLQATCVYLHSHFSQQCVISDMTMPGGKDWEWRHILMIRFHLLWPSLYKILLVYWAKVPINVPFIGHASYIVMRLYASVEVVRKNWTHHSCALKAS